MAANLSPGVAPDDGFRGRVSRRFRAKRAADLRLLIAELFRRNGEVKIADLGGRQSYWMNVGLEFLQDNNCNITIINLDDVEAHMKESKGLFRFLQADVTNLNCIADGSFHLAHSNSVIEHLGSWPAMLAFSQEASRIGRHIYVQTPNFFFPIDPHFPSLPFFHWLPRPIRAWLLERLPLATVGKISSTERAFHVVDSARLLDRRQFSAAFPQSQITPEKFFLLTKSFIAKGRGYVVDSP